MAPLSKMIEVSVKKTRGGEVLVSGECHADTSHLQDPGAEPQADGHFGPFGFVDQRAERLHGKTFDKTEVQAWMDGHGGKLSMREFIADKINELAPL
jgi:hypothetical protein